MRATTMSVVRFLLLFMILLWQAGTPVPAYAATLLVNAVDDQDDGVCDAEHCSLREAIQAANRNIGPDRIRFDLPGTPPYIIVLERALPSVTDDQTVIEGDSEPDYAGQPVIVLDGGSSDDEVALFLHSDGNAVFGLSLINFRTSEISASSCESALAAITTQGEDNLVADNYIGLDPSGQAHPNMNGIRIDGDRAFVQRNVISSNWFCEIAVHSGQGTSIQGNLIGTDPSGNESRSNTGSIGVHLSNPSDTLIGGDDPDQRNVISGHNIGISVGFLAAQIIGNYIGTNAEGTAALPNWVGIDLPRGYSLGEEPGGPRLVSRNVISGNTIGISGAWNHGGDVIRENLIGTNAAGTAAVGNTGVGILLEAGRDIPVEGNVISGNPTGIRLGTSDGGPVGTVLLHNRIGTNAAGTAAIPNGIGVHVLGTGGDTHIGQADPFGAGSGSNLISGNDIGVLVEADQVSVIENWIGTDVSGSGALPNGVGIQLAGGANQTAIGGIDYMGNRIAYNRGYGIYASSAMGAWIGANEIHDNGADGVMLSHSEPASLDLGAQITITKNSIYDNIGLGIQTADPAVNFGIRPPTLRDVGRDYAAGTACPGCRVELFLAAPDPSGAGEGRSFLESTAALPDGTFYVRFSALEPCQQVTATATDTLGNTSTFSLLADAGSCVGMPPPFVIITISLFGFGLAFLAGLIGLASSSERRLNWKIGIWAIGGGIAGIGLFLLLLAIPVIRVEWPPEAQQIGAAPLPACTQFLDMSRLSPPDGAAFDIGTDVSIELSPQPDPPGSQRRWTLTLIGPGSKQVTLSEMPVRASLSEIGFDPDNPGQYLWWVMAEQLEPGSNLWEPLCRDQAARLFSLRMVSAGQPPDADTEISTPTPTVTPTPTSTTTPTPTPLPAAAVALQNAHCRFGPNTQFEPSSILLQGDVVPIVGRFVDETWWFVLPAGEQYGCWVWSGVVDVNGDLSGVPYVQSPPTPTPTPVQSCWVWNANLQQNVCTDPCPANAIPGGACTP